MLVDHSSGLVFYQFSEVSYPTLVGRLDGQRLRRPAPGKGAEGLLACLERLQTAIVEKVTALHAVSLLWQALMSDKFIVL
eukprot:scaffold195002_cov24-Prasinocladus_malaysianus.AAC.1